MGSNEMSSQPRDFGVCCRYGVIVQSAEGENIRLVSGLNHLGGG